ncbi:MAG: alpha-L-fucosidase [archaeon]|nr:alpha-L-fucosidase [archaeon]
MNDLIKPTKSQLDWHDCEIGVFIHFSINTFNNKQWSNGALDPITFNPTHLDCEQWVKVAKDLGAKYMVMVTKHHDGFCLWQTKTTDYSVKSSPYKKGKGDIVKEFVEACRKNEMKIGFYLSPWDRNSSIYPDKEKYDKLYVQQLTELLVEYLEKDELFEFWLDGAGSKGRVYNWDSIIGTIKKYHPNSMIFNMGDPTIRWCQNEFGHAPYPNYYVIKKSDWVLYDKGKGFSDGTGDTWVPAEVNFPIRLMQWFYQKKPIQIPLLTLKGLIKRYNRSVGYGSNMLLGHHPDRRGLIPEKDAKRTKELGDEIRRRFCNIVAETSGNGYEIELILDRREINCIVCQEDIQFGQAIDSYFFEQWKENEWEPIKLKDKSLTIGYKKIDYFKNTINPKKIRLKIDKAAIEPKIKSLRAYMI